MLIETQARKHEQTYTDEHRKLLGTHYTPDSIVDCIVRRALQPLLESSDNPQGIRILDPACGSGLFLLKAFDVLAEHWQKSFGSFGPKEARHFLENSLFGIDIDEKAVSTARRLLSEKASLPESDSPFLNENILVADALSLKPPSSQIDLGNQTLDIHSLFEKHSFDCIVGNPPYVRIQNTAVEKRQHYISAYATASGRFDVANLFLELSEYLLEDQGRLGFIVSNKILSTAGAKRLRTFLLSHFSIDEIIDLSDTKLFEAAVLPMILVATRSKNDGYRIAYSSVTESHSQISNPIKTDNLLTIIEKSQIPSQLDVSYADRVFQVQRFYANLPSVRANVWTFHNERENRLLSKLRHNSVHTLGEIAEKISVGLKTTADTVFIKPMTKAFVEQKGFEHELIHPLLESHNVERWKCNWESERDLFVLYPHVEQNGRVVPIDLEVFPIAKKFLEERRSQLESRTYLSESGRRWYEIWVHQSPSDFQQTKIVTPDISTSNRFAIDNKGFFVNGTCFYIILKDKTELSFYSILGLLNSKVIEYFHKTASGNSLYAKRFRYWTSYIGGYPIPRRLFGSSGLRSALVQNVTSLLEHHESADRTNLEREIDLICYELFELSQSEIQDINSTLDVHQPSAKGTDDK
jgi:adenine-specific DNA-methyltransferase